MKPALCLRREPQRGVALVVTLMMLAVVTMMVVGLAGVMRNETAAARNLTYQVLAEQLAEIGAQQGMAVLLSNSTGAATPVATGPGWLLRINPGGGNTSLLTVLASSNAGTNVDLNRMGTNSMIFSMTNSNRATWPAIRASWTNLELPGTTAGNRVIGRFAWWIDDEGAKANLNAAASTNTNFFPLHHPFPLFTPRVLLQAGTGTNNWIHTNFMRRSNHLLTLESLKETNVGISTTNRTQRWSAYHSNKGHITVWSSNVDLNPWGEPKFSLRDLNNPAVVTDAATFSNLLVRTFGHPQLVSLFGQNYLAKYGAGNPALGSNVIRQTMANAYEAVSFQTNNPYRTNPLASTQTTTIQPGLPAVPAQYQGLNPAMVLLNDIAVGVSAYINGDDLQIQVWVVPELVTAGSATNVPLERTRIWFHVRNEGITIGGGEKGGAGVSTFGGFYALTTISNFPPRRSGDIATNGFMTTRTWGCFEYFWSANSGVGPLRRPGVTTQLTVRVRVPDVVVQQLFSNTWVATDWYDNGGAAPLEFRFPNGQIAPNGARVGVSKTTGQSFGAHEDTRVNLPPNMVFQGVSKNDPRARHFSAWGGFTNWNSNIVNTPNLSTLGGENSGTYDGARRVGTIGGLLKDWYGGPNPSATNEGKIWTPNTNWFRVSNVSVASWGTAGTNFPTVGTLGQLHTGLAWRTLRLLSQSDRASLDRDPDPPDWFLYELFTASTNPSVAAPRINLNSRLYSQGGTVTNRLPVVLSLLATLMNTNTVRFSGLFATNLIQPWGDTEMNYASNSMVTNSLRWGPGSTWANTRRTRFGVTNNDVFLFGSELAELDGVGNVGRTDEENEAMLMAAADLVTARSDTFSVWSAGQALAIQGTTGRTNVMGEVRRQTVFQRVPRIEGGRVTGYDLKVLYSRNHAVE